MIAQPGRRNRLRSRCKSYSRAMSKIWDLLLIRKIWVASACGQNLLGAVAQTRCSTSSRVTGAQPFVRQLAGSRHIQLLRETITSDVFVRSSFQSMILTVSKSLMNLVLSQLQNHPLSQRLLLNQSLLLTLSHLLILPLIRNQLQSQHLTQPQNHSQHLILLLILALSLTQNLHLSHHQNPHRSLHLTHHQSLSLIPNLILNQNHLQSPSPILRPSQSLLLSHSLIQVLSPSLIIILSKRSPPCSKRSRKGLTMITSTHGPRGRQMRSSTTSKSSSS